MRPKAKIFLDTSVIFAAVLSPEGGSRLLFRLGESGLLELVTGSSVLLEIDGVIRRKAPDTLPDLAHLLQVVGIKAGPKPEPSVMEQTRELIDYPPDAQVLAEAIQSAPEWFITLDRQHFLNNDALKNLPFRLGSPGDLIAVIRELLAVGSG